MQGFSFGLLVDNGHDAPVAGAMPRRRADAGWLAFGLRRLYGSFLNPWRRGPFADPGSAPGARRGH